jgi:hypothetical protein
MKNQCMSLEEFREIFQDGFESEEELLREYKSFLAVLEQLDQSVVPELTSRQKAKIFRQSWQGRPQESSWILVLLHFFKQPAMTFVLGIVIGCIIMSVIMNGHIQLTGTATAKEPLKVEHTGYSRIYKGTIIDDFYSEFENPEIVLEKAGQNAPEQRTLHGTLDKGEVYVVWNL